MTHNKRKKWRWKYEWNPKWTAWTFYSHFHGDHLQMWHLAHFWHKVRWSVSWLLSQRDFQERIWLGCHGAAAPSRLDGYWRRRGGDGRKGEKAERVEWQKQTEFTAFQCQRLWCSLTICSPIKTKKHLHYCRLFADLYQITSAVMIRGKDPLAYSLQNIQ